MDDVKIVDWYAELSHKYCQFAFKQSQKKNYQTAINFLDIAEQQAEYAKQFTNSEIIIKTLNGKLNVISDIKNINYIKLKSSITPSPKSLH